MEYYSSTFLISFNKTSMHWKIIAESTSFQLSYNHNILQMGVLRGHCSQLHPPFSQKYNLLLKSDIIDRNYHSQFHVLVWLLLSTKLKFNQNILKTRPPKLEQIINRISKHVFWQQQRSHYMVIRSIFCTDVTDTHQIPQLPYRTRFGTY